MIQTSLKQDLSTLTTIDESYINRLLDKSVLCISEAVADAVADNEDLIMVDVSFGYVAIKICENGIKYKFIPSKKLEKSVMNIVEGKPSDLTNTVENSLVTKLSGIYKSLL